MNEPRSLKAVDFERLLYLHSNRFMTPKIFREKFFPELTYFRALQLLNRYKKAGYVRFIKNRKFTDTAVILTSPALREIRDKRLAILSSTNEVKISDASRGHHERVMRLRLAIEKDPAFTDVFWVSDFEMACGIKPQQKWTHRSLSFEDREARANELRPKKKNRKVRTPDGYFEAVRGGQVETYIFEYEHSPYGPKLVKEIVEKLDKDFPKTRKLIVSQTPENSRRINNIIWNFMHTRGYAKRGGKPDLWYTTDYDHASNKPLDKTFRKLRNPKQEKP